MAPTAIQRGSRRPEAAPERARRRTSATSATAGSRPADVDHVARPHSPRGRHADSWRSLPPTWSRITGIFAIARAASVCARRGGAATWRRADEALLARDW